jgi:hypothetical protein
VHLCLSSNYPEARGGEGGAKQIVNIFVIETLVTDGCKEVLIPDSCSVGETSFLESSQGSFDPWFQLLHSDAASRRCCQAPGVGFYYFDGYSL